MVKMTLKAIREPFKTYDETVVSFIKFLITIAGGTIALSLNNDVSDQVAKIGLAFLLGTILLGTLCIHYLLMLKKADNPSSVNQDAVVAEKEKWGQPALRAYIGTIIVFLTGLILLIIRG